jgi:hypothetical protein
VWITGGFSRGQSGYSCATAKSGEKGSVLDMGKDMFRDMKIVKIEHMGVVLSISGPEKGTNKISTRKGYVSVHFSHEIFFFFLEGQVLKRV